MTYLQEVGNRIRKRRKDLKMTQIDLQHIIGYTSRSTIAYVEMGKIDLSQSRITQFANALGVTETYLLGLDDVNTSEISYLVSKLSDEDKQRVITFIKTFCKVGD